MRLMPMPSGSGVRGLLSERRGQFYRALATIAVLSFAVSLFFLIGNGVITWRVGVNLLDARLVPPDRLSLSVSSCNKNPEVSRLRETDVDVRIKVFVDIHPFLQGGQECLDLVEVQLQEPLGERDVVDWRSGQTVSIRK